jgi:phosphoribosyl-ATP pyrophosphohydrolase/phosphoribosyl-AMP cyclohydrolase
MSWTDAVKFDERGLVPVVAQDAASGEVLMLAWANRAALEATLASGQATYWSRSRQELWEKGASSGNLQRVLEIRVDCDADAVLYRVSQQGPACHTGERSCFYRIVRSEGLAPAGDARPVLARIAETLAARHAQRPEGSYTTYLFEQGVDKILKKVGEEAAETIIAAKNEDAAALVSESADLVFHLMVLWQSRGIPLAAIWEELERRHGAAPRPGSTDPAARRSSEVG